MKLFSFLLVLAHATFSTCTLVRTHYGLVEGETHTTYSGKWVTSFLGIPYADPPTGSYRFAPTRPLTSWSGTLEAKTLPNSCYQMVTKRMKEQHWYVSESDESEDCLYLNVWRPENVSTEELPVMIWIHPGAFSAGSSNLPLYDGSVLATQGKVVVVTLNYRLSVFGFLFLNPSQAPGNVGLADQIQAIKWVNQNIRHFGGDPNRITVFGHSAGSSSIGFHLFNKEVNGYFHNAIMQSGASNTLVPASTPGAALEAGERLARNMNCLPSDKEHVLQCLRKKKPEDLLAPYLSDPTYYNLNQFVPVNNGRELPLDPLANNQERPAGLNLISGDIPNELSSFFTSYFPGKRFNDDFGITELELRTFAKNIFQLGDAKMQDALLSQYVNLTEFCELNEFRNVAAAILTDADFICPQIEMTRNWSGTTRKAYYYDFAHVPTIRRKNKVPEWAGAVHGEELPFVFGQPLDPENGYNDQEAQLSKTMIEFWSSFATYGNPSSGQETAVVWPEVNRGGDLAYMEFGPPTRSRTSFKERECYFWKNVHPLLKKF